MSDLQRHENSAQTESDSDERPRMDAGTEWAATEAEKRRKALSDLARQQSSQLTSTESPTAPASPSPSSSSGTSSNALISPSQLGADASQAPRTPQTGLSHWQAILALVLVLSVVAGAVLYTQRAPSTPGHATVTYQPIIPRRDGLDCPQDVAWSPDNTHVAIIGYLRTCPDDSPSSYTYVPGLVNIYDTHTGKLVQQVQPDAAIEHADHIAPPSYATPPAGVQSPTAAVVTYTRVLWSPDGHQIALPFFVREWSSAQSVTLVTGLFLSATTGANARVLTHVVTPQDAPTLEWDLATGKTISFDAGSSGPPAATPSQSPSVNTAAFSTLTPALRYQWQADGHLVPEGLLAASGSASTATTLQSTNEVPVGTPDGGNSFSIWQPGTASLRIQSTTQQDIPGVYTWEVQFAAWSPDGRYVVTPLHVLGRLNPAGLPAPTAATLADLYLSAAPVIPLRDAGLRAIYAQMPFDHYDAYAQSVSVAWRPDGHLVAAQAQSVASGANAENQAVAIYDCQSGKAVTTLTPAVQDRFAMSEADNFLRWSPDGTHLLLLDGALGSVTIWAPKAA